MVAGGLGMSFFLGSVMDDLKQQLLECLYCAEVDWRFPVEDDSGDGRCRRRSLVVPGTMYQLLRDGVA